MFPRSPLLTFLIGGLLLGLGVILVLSAEPWKPTHLERWEDQQLPEDQHPLGALFTGAALVALGLVFTLAPVVQWVSQGGSKEAVLEPPAEGAALGGTTVVRVRLVPRRTLRVTSAKLHLITEEVAQYYEEATGYEDGEGGQYRTSVMEVHRWSTRLAIPQEVKAPFELEVPVPIPQELPPSFNWEHHMARTRLELEVELQGRMDLHLEQELLIVPRYASTGSGA